MKRYIVDTDVLIALYDTLPMTIYQTQWGLFKKYILEGKIIICEVVFNEIKRSVELKEWMNEFKSLILPCYTSDILIEAKTIINDFPKLIEITNPSDQADPYLIAIAKINDYTVLSNESNGENGRKTKIPYVCKKLNVDCMNIKDFYIEEKWKF